jgi:hypothetical protein
MNCPNCNTPIDEEMQACWKCGTAVFIESKKTSQSPRGLSTLGKVLLGVGLCLIVFFAVLPAIFNAHVTPNNASVSWRGKDIYVAIIGANTEREPLGFGPVWPKTCQASTNYPGDISSMVFTNSSDYFYELYDGANVGREQHDPYVRGFDYSKLAGAGVPAKVGGGKLTAENNMWAIAANITEEDADIIPVLITRNVDVKALEYIINHGGPTSNLDTRITLGAGPYKTPFGGKGFVMVRKGGGTFSNTAKYATLKFLFNSETLPPRDPSKPPIVYLMP